MTTQSENDGAVPWCKRCKSYHGPLAQHIDTMKTECEEVAGHMPVLPNGASMQDAREAVRRLMPDESVTVVDNTAEALLNRSRDFHKGPSRYVLVYQAGVANLFLVPSLDPNSRDAGTRIYRGVYRIAELMARGAANGGASVRYASCNYAGDVATQTWRPGLADCPFPDTASPISTRGRDRS